MIMDPPGFNRAHIRLAAAAAAVLFLASVPLAPSRAAGMMPQMPNAVGPHCDRACLMGILHQYLSGLVNHDPASVPFAHVVYFTENDVPLRIGDGLWGTIDGIKGGAAIEFADVPAGQIGYYGIVTEHGVPAYLALRLRVRHDKICEVESIVHRRTEMGPQANPATFKPDPAFLLVVPLDERTPRARMIDLVNGYFSTLQLNDGRIFTQFDPTCKRWENGGQSANNPASKNPFGKLSCGAQFKLGFYHWDTRVRDRAFLVVDEARGLVMARAFIDHSGVMTDYKLTNGESRVSPVKAPQTWCMLELFKIVGGRIYRIDAIFIGVPYYMRTPWVRHGHW
jgi:hypothetical protein